MQPMRQIDKCQSCRIKMLRYFYLLSLLIFTNTRFCYEYTYSDNESTKSPISRKLREAANLRHRRRNVEQERYRKRHDYDMDDRDPVAQIDVANFIKTPEDVSFGENDPYGLQYNNIKQGIYYNDYGNLNEINSNEKSYNNEDYSDINAEYLKKKSVNFNLDDVLMEDKNMKVFPGVDSLQGDDLLTNNIHHHQKKCALKNIKLPFFSHNKTVTIKNKKNKKRKLYGSNKVRQEDVISKANKNGKLAKHNDVHGNQNRYYYYKIDKRSYVERLCPVCMRKFIINKNRYSRSKRRDILKNSKTTRKHNNYETNSEDESKNTHMYKLDVDVNNHISKEEADFKDSWRDRRRKREEDNRIIERQKELDDLERRVENVVVNGSSYSKISPKV